MLLVRMTRLWDRFLLNTSIERRYRVFMQNKKEKEITSLKNIYLIIKRKVCVKRDDSKKYDRID